MATTNQRLVEPLFVELFRPVQRRYCVGIGSLHSTIVLIG